MLNNTLLMNTLREGIKVILGIRPNMFANSFGKCANVLINRSDVSDINRSGRLADPYSENLGGPSQTLEEDRPLCGANRLTSRHLSRQASTPVSLLFPAYLLLCNSPGALYCKPCNLSLPEWITPTSSYSLQTNSSSAVCQLFAQRSLDQSGASTGALPLPIF